VIQVLELHIEEFRGIRNLDLKLDGKSFVVHGPNGSGKSGVVDAIGFAFTGTIARLTGPGTAGVSVQKHGPHVHRRDDPGAAKVTLTFRDTASGQTGVIVRDVKNSNNYSLTPDTSELRKAIDSVRLHPELTLSRREIIKFILSESGKRATEVQALLQLDALDEQRKTLKTALGKISRDKTAAETTLNGARATMMRHLDLPKLLPADVERVINERRTVLGLSLLPEVTLETDFKQGIDDEKAEVAFDKPSAVRDIEALQTRRADTTDLDLAIGELKSAIAEFGDDPSILESLKHRSLVETGLALLVDEAVCPLCDTPWESLEQLQAHLKEKIELSQAAARREQDLKKAAAVVVGLMRSERDIVKPVQKLAASWGTPETQVAVQAWQDKLLQRETQLATVVGTLALRDEVEAGLLTAPPELTTELASLLKVLNKKPDTSAKTTAQSYLVIAAERWTQLRLARQSHDKATIAHQFAEIAYKTYCDVADQALANLYSQVEARFSEFYRQINAEDEAGFKAELEPSAGSLDLRVDFYGLGMFPPGAYHSEGHQDGMGVCLYLALVEKLLGSGFRFAVLDDVVMSVDSSHRRQFCELLKTEFPDVQFIITTHDEIWAKQMQSSQLISKRSQIRFQGWTVDTGPAFEQGSDFWYKIKEDLAKDDVSAAAHKLRRGLEAELPELAEELRARVTYRGDAKYELGELLNAIKGRHNDWLKKASSSANSWNSEEAKKRVQELKDARAKAMLAQEEESWAINALVHYNEWASMTKEDFAPVVQAWQEFLQLFRCDNAECESWIAVGGMAGAEDALRCRCGQYNLNLLSKTK
jgi:recombinational DNA repair ATPase RecF